MDFDQKLSEEIAYRLSEWIFEGYFRFIGGDYSLLDSAEVQCKMLDFWKNDDSDTVVISFK